MGARVLGAILHAYRKLHCNRILVEEGGNRLTRTQHDAGGKAHSAGETNLRFCGSCGLEPRQPAARFTAPASARESRYSEIEWCCRGLAKPGATCRGRVYTVGGADAPW